MWRPYIKSTSLHPYKEVSFSHSTEGEKKVMAHSLKHFCWSRFTSLLSHSCQKQVWEWEEFHTSLCRGITVGNEVWTRSSTSFCHKEWEGDHCSTRRLWTVSRQSQPSSPNYSCQLNKKNELWHSFTFHIEPEVNTDHVCGRFFQGNHSHGLSHLLLYVLYLSVYLHLLFSTFLYNSQLKLWMHPNMKEIQGG